MKKTLNKALITAIILCIASVTRSTGNNHCDLSITEGEVCYKKDMHTKLSAITEKEPNEDFIFTNRLLFF